MTTEQQAILSRAAAVEAARQVAVARGDTLAARAAEAQLAALGALYEQLERVA